ncbi:UDP-glucuronic acid decarboxylase family protein [Cellulomonas fimi]|uniref:NAD-dependent epimerase/dehydratase n=1 Tax=Cellulomonas fimi (strain ATCC 484 / DSM 20113 / JCM 1341 / CCUG 24087 / LMG 16345 / NBRC 15513 / NCIMB 8980 / NCTC 7547 / NRS-133) TaxID=590998 RepID=F4H5Z5_CELFA|nr:UDP-glucuronic acid decarboxylase family protein [Cellulomonas fimi]AEE46725.1 NAD-dependent epimerase/dehydratase [Cellulomonas fimi ATCC 484]NNH07630.1 SDR family oxidoreductase [Cellulomonas fimi]VEH33997.1 dTDP-glucose 4,6-dehydratase [Cellulomonas fimi]
MPVATTDSTSLAHARPRRPVHRAVVTGGAGFLGSHLCTALLDRGAEVVCLDSFLTGSPANVAHLLGRPGFHLQRCDLTDFVHVPGPVDLVLHLASPASPVDYLQLPIETLKVGSIGTAHALGLAKDKGARFLLASTSEVYGDPQVHPQPESYWGHVNPVGPRGVYDEAKRFAEAITTAYRSTHGVDTAIVRIFNTYGPRMRPRDGRAIPTFVRQALAGEPVTVAGTGEQTRSVCFVDDLVEGVLGLAASGHPGPMNIGNPEEMTVLRIAQDVIAATGSSSTVEHVGRPVDDPEVRRPDITLARTELGWEPRVAWADGLRRTVEWFAQELSVSA